MNILKIFKEMSTLNEPWGLYTPTLYKNKIGDVLWHCKLISTCGPLFHKTRKILKEAIWNCYHDVTNQYKKLNKLKEDEFKGGI